MSLENLLRIGQLKRHVTDATEVGRLLEASAAKHLGCKCGAISVETRFDAAYKAIIPSVTLLTLERAAKALGKRITVELAA